MKLGVFINQTFYFDDNQSSTDLSFIRFIESFFQYFNEIEIFAPSLEKTRDSQGYYQCSGKTKLCPLPFFGNVKELAKKVPVIIPKTREILEKKLPECSVVWIVGPHPLGLLVYRVARRNAVQTFYHIRGNILNDVGTRYHGKEFWLARAYAQFMHMASKFLSRRMPTMVVGSELFDLYSPFSSNIFQISPSLIKNSDIDLSERLFSTKEFGRRDVINLLFVGRLEPEKGLEFLFSAMRDFNDNSSVPCNLTIVGTAQKGSEGKEIIIRERARQLGLSDSITWKGYVAYGNDLLNIYRNADIFVLPSLAEGIPKVLYEAMATGVPIICSKVGGIPDVITHSKNGLLISPGSSTELYSAIQELAGSPNLRATLIQAGFETVREHTSEKARDQIVRILEQCGIALPVTNEHQGN